MRVTFTSAEDFCAELSREAAAGCVWRKQVRTRIDRAPEQDEEISFLVAVIGTAIVHHEEDGDYLLEYSEICGSDDPDQTPNNAGTFKAREKVDMIKAVAQESGLQCLPGRFEA